MLSRQYRLASVSDLEAIRGFVEQAALSLGGQPEAVGDLIVAVNEAVTNILLHGYKNRPGDLLLEIHGDDAYLQVILEDRAPLYDPTKVPEPDVSLPLERRLPGGVGVKMMRAFTDDMRYEATAAGTNRLVLIKRKVAADPDS